VKRCISAKNDKGEYAYAEQFIADGTTFSLSPSFEAEDGRKSLAWEGTVSYKVGTKFGNFDLGTVEVHVRSLPLVPLGVRVKMIQLGRSLFANLAQALVGVAIQSSSGQRSHSNGK
jgi:hypothetical protein